MINVTPEYLASQGLSDDFPTRFWKKVKKTQSCWIWTASSLPRGYGIIRAKEKLIIASRASWILHNGPIPEDLFVLHNCPNGDNPACVNPEHLWLGTKKDNAQDTVRKGRYTPHTKFGQCHPLAKLTYQIADEIRVAYSSGQVSQRQLAKLYGVDQKAIWMCLKNITWVHQ